MVYSPKGISMLPFINPGTDSVVLKKPEGPLKKGDVAFYRRDNGKFVLHRVVKVKNGTYRMCGDNLGFIEKNIEDRHIIAVVCRVVRNGESVDLGGFKYKLYIKTLVFKRFKINFLNLRYPKAVLRRIIRIFKRK